MLGAAVVTIAVEIAVKKIALAMASVMSARSLGAFTRSPRPRDIAARHGKHRTVAAGGGSGGRRRRSGSGALQLQEVRVLHEPVYAVPHFAGRLAGGHGVDDRPEQRPRPVDDQRRHAEA